MEQIDRLIELNIEIEGLLHVFARQDSLNVRRLLQRKKQEFDELLSRLLDGETTVEVKAEEAVESELPQEIELSAEAIDRGGIPEEAVTSAIPDRADTIEEAPAPVQEPYPDEIIISPEEPEQEEAPEPTESVEAVDSVEYKAAEFPEPAEPSEKNEKAAPIPEPTVSIADAIGSRQNEIRVDEMISRREARDLRKAFTINDKFRFRRELFSNDDKEFGRTLDMIEAMGDFDEACEYLREDLGWDMDNDDVKDFLSTVRNHFA